MYKNPSERFGIKKDIADGEKANLTVFDLNKKYNQKIIINKEVFYGEKSK